MRIGTSRACLSALIVICSLAVACGSGSDSSGSEPAIGPVPVINDTAALSLPLDSYGLDAHEYTTVRRAAWRLIRDCVSSYGGTYTAPEALTLGDVPQFEHPHERRYGLFDETSAAARGYNVPPEQRPLTEGKTMVWDPSDAEKLLVRGADRRSGAAPPRDAAGRELPEGGCQGEADRVLGAGTAVPADQNLGNELAYEANHRALGDSRVRAEMKRWSECMARQGYHYETVWDPNQEPWPEPANDKEIATAVADVRCKREVNLLGTMMAVEAAYHQRVIDQRAEELAVLQTHIRAEATAAARIVSGT
jgi:hypothetical protein